MRVGIAAGLVCLSINILAHADVYDSAVIAGISTDQSSLATMETLASKGFVVRRSFPEINLLVLDSKKHAEPNQLAAEVAAIPGIRFAEPNYSYKLLRTPNEDNRSSRSLSGLEAAWDYSIGSHDVVVADSDTGVDMDHEDLRSNIWTNRGEIPGNNIDDDHNGFIDDVHGWNFAENNNNPSDDHNHGTHVAGIIGAEGDNGTGIAGVNWKLSIMPLKFITAKGEGSLENGIATILYAVNNGARIVNTSWGDRQFSQAFVDALNYAFKKNVLVVAAAGNYNKNADLIPLYPAAFQVPNIVSVAAYDPQQRLAWFSNYGPTSVHIAAPGVSIFSCIKGNAYKFMSGTSMAAPLATGVAALMLSVRPDLSVVDLRNALFNGTVPFSSMRLAVGGRVKADLAVKQLLNPAVQVWPNRIRVKKGSTFQFTGFNAHSPRWHLGNAAVGSIDSTGTLKAQAAGESFVELIDADGKSYRNQEVIVVD